jgi:predicted transcriptional regulator
MKHILVELDDRCARDLERVAPAKKRMRAEFVRLAIRQAIDLALEGATARAYLARPLALEAAPADLVGWDPHNELARASGVPKGARRRSRVSKGAA